MIITRSDTAGQMIRVVWIDESRYMPIVVDEAQYMPMNTTITTSNTASTIWTGWCDNMTHTTTSATANSVWAVWTGSSTTTSVYPLPRRVVETPEQAAQRSADRERWRAEQEARIALERRITAEASARAEQLLLGVLSAEQRETYQRARHIIVIGRSGRRYRVRRGRVGNVDVIGRNGHIESRLCAHPGVWTPEADVVLAQLLHLQHDDDAFCRTANVHHVLTQEGQILPALQ